MDQIDRLRRLGLFDSRVPRYTSFPTTPNFSPSVGARFQAECLAAVDPAEPVSVYVHIPFCERLCWFCACHTQGTKTLAPVEAYIAALEAELALVAASLPPGVRMGRLHWGGGTPTILPPPLIHRIAAAIRAAIPPADTLEFSVEIDPTQVDRARIAALAEEGMTRASLGVQDFDPLVQQAIGRLQSFEATREAIEALRDCGVESLNADLVYGLPHQTLARLDATLERTLSLRPDRLALFGYAHVPWASKRQKLIDEATLPGDEARFWLAQLAADRFIGADYRRIGIDHFARPGDGLFAPPMFDAPLGRPRDLAHLLANHPIALLLRADPTALRRLTWVIQYAPEALEPWASNFYRGEYLLRALATLGIANTAPVAVVAGARHSWQSADRHIEQTLPIHWAALARRM